MTVLRKRRVTCLARINNNNDSNNNDANNKNNIIIIIIKIVNSGEDFNAEVHQRKHFIYLHYKLP